ncbi:MAG: D-alanyl-D-alanine carboxypeptidase [Phormidesmis priestleyi Ana]|uniref:D-alanyl-D-alanine carboxypeptidase n=1 Tax=Phormidesmis priestleyi Ana TaxID=1666911 RepID=A0A0P8A0V9_9CYAN|nr:MAG: D-alanyl-D-alanine carboxypeptidase [Phormidesmis priestleyi Ana]
MNFSVEGDIPEGGITVNLEGDVARIMQQFTVAQTRFDAETGNILYRFDNGFVNPDNGFVVGGILDRFSLEDGDPSETNSNEAAAGTGFLSNFSFTITEATASITIPVLDDLIEEPDQTFTYTLAEGEGYTVNSNASSGTFTVTDGVVGGIGPTVEISSTPGTLYESEPTAITINLRTRGEIPDEGVVVFVEGPPRAIAEFDVNATNPRLPEAETVVEGIVVAGGSIVGTNETAGGFFFRVTEEFSSISVPVFQDDVVEGDETLVFTLRDGENYQVREGRESFSVTINDTDTPPIVTLTSSSPTLLSESEGSVLELNFSAIGTIPESGTTVVLEITDPLLLGEQIGRPSGEGDNVGITIPRGSRTTINDDDGNFVKLLQRIVITEANATLRLPVVDDILKEEDASYTITLVDGEGYNIDAAAANTATFTVTDGEVPTELTSISLSSTPGTLYESEQTVLSLSLVASRQTPFPEEGGLVVFIDSDVPAALGEFDINGSARTGEVEGVVVSGGEIVGTDEDASGFFLRMDERNVNIRVPVFPDDIAEGTETFTFTLVPGEAYEGRDGSDSVTFAIEDAVEPPVVTLASSSPTLVSESEGSVLELNFSTTGTIPESGTTVVMEITDPNLFGEQITAPSGRGENINTGITISRGFRETITDEDGNFVKVLQRLTITEPNAVLRLPVIDDIFKEEDASYTITLVDGEGYNIDAAAANTATFTVTDGVIPETVPVVGINATPEALYESDQTVLTLSLNIEEGSVLPEDGLVVFIDSGSPGVLGEFAINGNARTGLVEGIVVTGGEIVGTDDDVSGFFFRLTDPTAIITVPVFQDEVVEGLETFTFNLVQGEAYDVSPTQGSITITIDDVRQDIIVGTEDGETIVGSDTSDYIQALGGNDTVAGGLGDDIIEGGDGDDILRGDRNDRSTQDGEPGGNDIIFGGAGNDRIGGKAGNDILSGDAGDDLIWGDDGDDIIMGGVGNDILVGDNFSGGSGSDLFVFGNGDGTDTILDFEVGIDRIGLVEGELTFADLTITQNGNDALLGITSSGETLAILKGVQASALEASSFEIVSIFSTPEEALLLM